MEEKLIKICELFKEYDMYSNNTFRLHSKSKYFIKVNNIEELKEIINILKEYNSKWFIIGNGSNIILPSYYDGVIIKLEGLNNYKIENNILYAESGCMLNKIATLVSNQGYTGFEWATGIPGTIGGSVVGNAGAYLKSISDLLISATVYDGEKIYEMSNKDFKYEYRNSILKGNHNIVILSCTFKLEKGNIDDIKALIIDRTTRRISTQDLKNPSNGSVFRNPETAPAGKLIDDAGLKGTTVNDAQVSNIHANFIINKGNATSEDIIKLIEIVKEKIKEIYDIELHLEQEIIK